MRNWPVLLALLVACDSTDTDADSIDEVVQSVPPVAHDLAVVVVAEQAADIQLSGTGADGLYYEVVAPPESGLLTGELTGKGAVIYTPAEGFVGQDRFTYRAVDRFGESKATVTVSVVADPSIDTDGDGLTDVDEADIYGTNWTLPDTDHDGFSDYQEVVDLGFDPANNPYRFNPLLADVPRIAVDMVSPPEVGLRQIRTDGTGLTVTSTNTHEVSSSTSFGRSNTNSTTTEQSHSGTVTLGLKKTTGLGKNEVEKSVSLSYTYANSRSTSSSHTTNRTDASGNRDAWATARATARQTDVTTDGGYVTVATEVRNIGHVAFTLKNLALTLTRVARADGLGTRLVPVGGLDLDTQYQAFPATTLAPGDAIGPLVFEKTDLPYGVAEELLRDSNPLVTDVALSEMSDEDGRPFAHSTTAILANSINFLVDYGPNGLDNEQYYVSARATPSESKLTLRDLLERAHIPHDDGREDWDDDRDGTIDRQTFRGLLEVRGQRVDADVEGSWQIVHVHDDGTRPELTVLDLTDAAYNLDSFELLAGDIVHLVYVSDADADGVWSREEGLVGTDPDNADTDGDTVDDARELHGDTITVNGELREVASNPLVLDTDEDGVPDAAEWSLGTDPSDPDTDGDWIVDLQDLTPAQSASTDLGSLDARVTTENPSDYTAEVSWTLDNTIASEGAVDHGVLILARAEPTPVGFEAQFPEMTTFPITGIPHQVGDTFACDGLTNCWEVVAVPDTAQATGLVSWQVPKSHTARFVAWVRINGIWHPSSLTANTTDSYDYSTLKFTVHDYSWDYCVEVWDWDWSYTTVADGTCETYLYVNGSINGSSPFRIASTPTVSVAGVPNGTRDDDVPTGPFYGATLAGLSFTRTLPQIQNYCYTLIPAVAERDYGLQDDTDETFAVTTCWDASTGWSNLASQVESPTVMMSSHYPHNTTGLYWQVNSVGLTWSLEDVTP